MSQALNDSVKNLLMTVLEISNCENLSMTGCPEWTSLKHIEIIMALEEEFEVSFEPADIPTLTSLEAICNKLTSLGVK